MDLVLDPPRGVAPILLGMTAFAHVLSKRALTSISPAPTPASIHARTRATSASSSSSSWAIGQLRRRGAP
ncbi:hypothetical protein [Streptomyces sp. NRRL S-1022]|uniref:hypothetical protein n=1 Tax=Streptomyces sp. NRRL S-1022 TaxID=1463880 RepID=UPI0004BEB321|nr:hypothetical protein [Streptomyces sp. NRRL S-1022]